MSTLERLIELEERRLREHLAHELEMNAFIESRCPGLRETARYKKGPVPPWHPMWNSEAHYTSYEIRRAMGRFNPNIDYPTAKDPSCSRSK
jgi:hypothetical protein